MHTVLMHHGAGTVKRDPVAGGHTAEDTHDSGTFWWGLLFTQELVMPHLAPSAARSASLVGQASQQQEVSSEMQAALLTTPPQITRELKFNKPFSQQKIKLSSSERRLLT